ncbi:hypothetical protein [Stackebrandtia albiflava]|uniref:hypothetical protein n=1 Tax=Stackebrandtia albiflava TaxID=406432 RepID=UPI0011BDF4CA|nr:hypothetical protein [Stackebrandtia albiflava]
MTVAEDGSVAGLSHKEYGEYHEALHGYNPHLVVDESDIPNQQAVTVGDRTVLYSTAGCRFEVQDRVFDGEVESYHEHTYLSVRGIQQGVMTALEVQSEVIAAYDDWAVCMSEASYPGLLDVGRFRQVIVDEVWNPIADRDPQPGTPLFEEAKAEEVAMAMVHIGCDEQVGLRQTHLDTVDRLTAEYLVSHETELFAWYEMLSTARERAGELLGR